MLASKQFNLAPRRSKEMRTILLQLHHGRFCIWLTPHFDTLRAPTIAIEGDIIHSVGSTNSSRKLEREKRRYQCIKMWCPHLYRYLEILKPGTVKPNQAAITVRTHSPLLQSEGEAERDETKSQANVHWTPLPRSLPPFPPAANTRR